MVGSGLKKLAAENGLKVSHGVAYGDLKGYATTLSEGMGYKRIVITTQFSDVDKKNELAVKLNSVNLGKEFRIRNLEFFFRGIVIVFLDNPGTMKKIKEFIEWFYPLLDEYSASGVQKCQQCGNEITDAGSWKLINGLAYHFHSECGGQVYEEVKTENEERLNEDNGSYIRGILGAVLGALIGGIVWAIVLNVGYVASIVGLLIGWLAEKGYTLLKGKQGKVKPVILVGAAVLGVAVGTVGSVVLEMVKFIAKGEAGGWTYSEIPIWLNMFYGDSANMSATIGDFVIGLIFAFIGCFSFIKRKGMDVSDTKVIDLK